MMIAASAAILGFAIHLFRSAPLAVTPLTAGPVAGVTVEPISLRDAVIKGSPRARTVVIEYSDFECPFCRSFARATLPEVTARYIETGVVQFVFRHLPLPRHTRAFKAAEAAECAGHDGKFWEMHDSLFLEPARLELGYYVERAQVLGLEPRRFATCLAGEAADHVRADVAEARRLGVNGTPTFFLGNLRADGRVEVTRRHAGVLSIDTFERLIKETMAVAAPGRTE